MDDDTLASLIVTTVAGISDTVAPTVTITSTASTITTAAFTCTFTFSENVTGFALGDITVGNGSAGTFNTVSASVYTAVITPTATGTVTVDVAGGVCTDAAGNNNTAATQFSILYVSAELWLDFSIATGLYQTNDTSTPVTTDGQSIGYSTDKSGMGNHATQATAGARPTYKANIQNGKSVARSDGGDNLAGAITQAQPFTVIAVCKPDAIGVRQYILRSAFNVQMRFETTGNLQIYAGSFVNSTVPTTAVWQIVSGVFNGASSRIYKNGAAASAIGDIGTNTLSGYVAGDVITGDEGELFVIPGALSDAVRGQIETYLNTKWTVF